MQLLETVGGEVYVLGTRRQRGDHPGTRQTPGLPDLYVFLPSPRRGAFLACALWIEVKAPGGRLRPAQAAFRALCRHEGRAAHIAGTLDDVRAWLVAGGWLIA